MEPLNYQRKYESLKRSLKRLEEFYLGKIDNSDSFNGPKDFVFSYFDCTYSLKESLKSTKGINVEGFINNNTIIALGIDISNINKHGELDRPKTKFLVGRVNTHIHILGPKGKDRTELTIEIDGIKNDCLNLARSNFNVWETYLLDNNLLK